MQIVLSVRPSSATNSGWRRGDRVTIYCHHRSKCGTYLPVNSSNQALSSLSSYEHIIITTSIASLFCPNESLRAVPSSLHLCLLFQRKLKALLVRYSWRVRSRVSFSIFETNTTCSRTFFVTAKSHWYGAKYIHSQRPHKTNHHHPQQHQWITTTKQNR